MDGNCVGRKRLVLTIAQTLLPNGQVLITGGVDGVGHALASSELYDPATGSWAATGTMSAGRYYDKATLLPNGKVLDHRRQRQLRHACQQRALRPGDGNLGR